MSLLDRLADEETWLEFREYKSRHSLMSQREFDALDAYIAEKRYLPLARTLEFSLPEKRRINKSGSTKKRTVYLFPEDETWVLKLLTWLLYKYDGAFRPSCFSFRQNYTAKTAFGAILRVPDLDAKYVLKADIHDYFNSMPPDLLVKELAEVIDDDPELLAFLTDLFTVNKALEEGPDGEFRTIEENRGAMAGVPLSAFCANIYLASVDRLFEERGVPYFRYSDDILILADSAAEREDCFETLKREIAAKGLELNPAKVATADPGEPWDFLGFKYKDGGVDLADATVRKMKARIRRKAHALYRWKIRKNDVDGESEFTWSRWFFPVLTRVDGLRTLDAYLVQYIRYLWSGRHYKGNYAVTYEHIKELGFRSLVHEYYRFRETERPARD